MSFLRLGHLEKTFGDSRVVRDFSLDIAEGEFVSLLGPSGCGKTTVLRMVAGFETPTSGTVHIGAQDVTRLRPNQRDIGMVFQAYALFPNLTVADNIGFGLKIKGLPADRRRARVGEMLRLIGLPDLGSRYPFQLSGGQQQRVALARALAPSPKVLLLDEPLSALDAKIRVSLRTEIREIQRRTGITTIFVTHDQEEALSMSDRVVVMYGGIAEQTGTPFQVYNQPATPFVAGFVGTLNTLRGTASGGRVTLGQAVFPLAAPDGPVTLALRPEAVRLGPAPGREITLPAVIEDVHFMGAVIRIRARAAGSLVALDTFNHPDTPPPAVGDRTEISLSSRDVLVLG